MTISFQTLASYIKIILHDREIVGCVSGKLAQSMLHGLIGVISGKLAQSMLNGLIGVISRKYTYIFDFYN